MGTLPQLFEDDVRKLDATLSDFLTKTDATLALVIDKGGFLITHQGEPGDIDVTTIGALASGAFMASQTIAGLVKENDFNHTALNGETTSIFTCNVDEHCLLLVVFPTKVGVGVVKYFSTNAITRLAKELDHARERDPEGGLDLSAMNVVDSEELFRKKAAN